MSLNSMDVWKVVYPFFVKDMSSFGLFSTCLISSIIGGLYRTKDTRERKESKLKRGLRMRKSTQSFFRRSKDLEKSVEFIQILSVVVYSEMIK